MNLDKLLRPKTMAIIGASEKEGFGGDTCRNIMEYADLDKVFFVHPKRDEVFGRKCWHSLSELPGAIDLVVICTNKNTVPDLLREAAAKGAGGAVVYASGYSETGTAEGKQAEEDLKALCTELNMALMGPNCGGFINYVDKAVAFAFISEKRDRTGSVGVVSQSGQLCLSLMDSKGLRFSYSISAGNSSVVTMEDYLQFLVDDPHTKVVGLYMEGASRPDKFAKALRDAALKRKPVVVLKTGRSAKGSRVAASHTGSLAGADRVYDALFAKFGVIRVNDVEELKAMTAMLDALPSLPVSTGIAAINFSGGETGICADVADMFGVEYPEFTAETEKKLREILPDFATPVNPLDTTAAISYDADAYGATVQAVMDDPSIGMVVLGYTLLHEIADPCIHYMYQGLEKVMASGRAKPAVMLPFLENSRHPEYQEKLRKLGIPVLPPPMYGFPLIKNLLNFLAYDPKAHTLDLAIPRATTPAHAEARTLSEFDSAARLKEYGIATPPGEVVPSREDAVRVAESVGYPVVMKIASADIPHKSDVGGVQVGLGDRAEVEAAYDKIMANVAKNAPGAALDGILVQKMLKPGMQCIIGVQNDPQFGPAVLVGLGGVFVEVFKDTVLLPAPFTRQEALEALKTLKAFKLFTGYRGGEKLDVDALADMIANVARFAADNRDSLVELDINPVFVYPRNSEENKGPGGQGVCAADALMVIRG